MIHLEAFTPAPDFHSLVHVSELTSFSPLIYST
jgi:hypothetical protein